MSRKLMILGVCAGCSAAVPAFLGSDPARLIEGVWQSFRQEEAASAEPAKSSPSRQVSLAEAGAGRSVAIPADANGHFRAEFKINGRRVTGMVDTGATLVALNESTARKLGVNLKASDFQHEVQTANGTARAAVARLNSLAIGRIHLEDVDALVLEDAALGGTLVGMSFLSRLNSYRVEDGMLQLKQ